MGLKVKPPREVHVRNQTRTMVVAATAEAGGSYVVSCQDALLNRESFESVLSFVVPPAKSDAAPVGQLSGTLITLDTVAYRTFELKVGAKGTASDFKSHQEFTSFVCELNDAKTGAKLCQIWWAAYRDTLELDSKKKNAEKKEGHYHVKQGEATCRRFANGTFGMLAIRQPARGGAAPPGPEEENLWHDRRQSRVVPEVFFVDVWSRKGGKYEVYCDDRWQQEMAKSPVVTMEVPPSEEVLGVRNHTVLKFELGMMNRGFLAHRFAEGKSRSFFRCHVTDGARKLCEVSKSWTSEPNASRTISTYTERDVTCMLKYGESVNVEFGEVRKVPD